MTTAFLFSLVKTNLLMYKLTLQREYLKEARAALNALNGLLLKEGEATKVLYRL